MKDTNFKLVSACLSRYCGQLRKAIVIYAENAILHPYVAGNGLFLGILLITSPGLLMFLLTWVQLWSFISAMRLIYKVSGYLSFMLSRLAPRSHNRRDRRLISFVDNRLLLSIVISVLLLILSCLLPLLFGKLIYFIAVR